MLLQFRTDLAIEKEELLTDSEKKGVRVKKWNKDNTDITLVEITDVCGEKSIGKPKGKYYTIELPEFSHETELLDGRLTAITDIIKDLLPTSEDLILVAGVGNDNITPDALGPLCAEQIFVTRHMENILTDDLFRSDVRPVSSISTGVLGQTGLEAAEYIKAIVDSINPVAVVVVDALASKGISHLGKTIQLSDTGISPGSGVGNYRKKIDSNYLGIPVIAIGVPTVVDGKSINETLEETENMIVTPSDIDTIIHRASRLLALSINCALHQNIDPQLLLSLM